MTGRTEETHVPRPSSRTSYGGSFGRISHGTKGENLPHAERLFTQGRAFHEGGLRCLELRPLPNGFHQTAGASGVVCLAFAAELYLKTLQVLAEGKTARGHKLLPLFEALPQATQADVQRRYVERLERLGRRRVTFLRDLTALSDTFTVWRYIYEQKPGRGIELGFLQHLVASL